jgi:hypothetical protein
VGVSGVPSIQPKSEPLHVDGGLPLRLFVQPPRIAALFQLRDGVIGDGVTFLFSQPNLQAAYDLSGAPPCEGNCVPEDFSLCHWRNRTKRELACKPLHLAHGGTKAARRRRELEAAVTGATKEPTRSIVMDGCG